MTIPQLAAHLKIFAKGVGADIQKLASSLAAKLDVSVFTTFKTTELPTAITSNPVVSALKAESDAAAAVTLDMIAEANAQITDTTLKLPNS